MIVNIYRGGRIGVVAFPYGKKEKKKKKSIYR